MSDVKLCNEKAIRVGDQWVVVPADYLPAEREYCRATEEAFLALDGDHPDKERLCKAVLDKRVEFCRVWKAILKAKEERLNRYPYIDTWRLVGAVALCITVLTLAVRLTS